MPRGPGSERMGVKVLHRRTSRPDTSRGTGIQDNRNGVGSYIISKAHQTTDEPRTALLARDCRQILDDVRAA